MKSATLKISKLRYIWNWSACVWF